MNIMIKRLVTVFGMPDRPDVRAFLAEYAKATDGDESTLDVATDILLASYTRPGWPPIGECRAAITKAANKLHPPQPFVPEHEKPLPPPTPEQAARANALVADLRRSMANMDVSEKKDGKRLVNAPDRNAFDGRLSPVFNCRWSAPPLADSPLVKRSLEIVGLTERSKAMMGERDE